LAVDAEHLHAIAGADNHRHHAVVCDKWNVDAKDECVAAAFEAWYRRKGGASEDAGESAVERQVGKIVQAPDSTETKQVLGRNSLDVWVGAGKVPWGISRNVPGRAWHGKGRGVGGGDVVGRFQGGYRRRPGKQDQPVLKIRRKDVI